MRQLPFPGALVAAEFNHEEMPFLLSGLELISQIFENHFLSISKAKNLANDNWGTFLLFCLKFYVKNTIVFHMLVFHVHYPMW